MKPRDLLKDRIRMRWHRLSSEDLANDICMNHILVWSLFHASHCPAYPRGTGRPSVWKANPIFLGGHSHMLHSFSNRYSILPCGESSLKAGKPVVPRIS